MKKAVKKDPTNVDDGRTIGGQRRHLVATVMMVSGDSVCHSDNGESSNSDGVQRGYSVALVVIGVKVDHDGLNLVFSGFVDTPNSTVWTSLTELMIQLEKQQLEVLVSPWCPQNLGPIEANFRS